MKKCKGEKCKNRNKIKSNQIQNSKRNMHLVMLSIIGTVKRLPWESITVKNKGNQKHLTRRGIILYV